MDENAMRKRQQHQQQRSEEKQQLLSRQPHRPSRSSIVKTGKSANTTHSEKKVKSIQVIRGSCCEN